MVTEQNITEKQKMMTGLPFNGGDPELMQDKSHARTIAERYNRTTER